MKKKNNLFIWISFVLATSSLSLAETSNQNSPCPLKLSQLSGIDSSLLSTLKDLAQLIATSREIPTSKPESIVAEGIIRNKFQELEKSLDEAGYSLEQKTLARHFLNQLVTKLASERSQQIRDDDAKTVEAKNLETELIAKQFKEGKSTPFDNNLSMEVAQKNEKELWFSTTPKDLNHIFLFWRDRVSILDSKTGNVVKEIQVPLIENPGPSGQTNSGTFNITPDGLNLFFIIPREQTHFSAPIQSLLQVPEKSFSLAQEKYKISHPALNLDGARVTPASQDSAVFYYRELSEPTTLINYRDPLKKPVEYHLPPEWADLKPWEAANLHIHFNDPVLSPDGRRLGIMLRETKADKSLLLIYDRETGKYLGALNHEETGAGYFYAFSADSKKVIGVSKLGIFSWPLDHLSQNLIPPAHSFMFTNQRTLYALQESVVLSADGKYAALETTTPSLDIYIEVFSISDGLNKIQTIKLDSTMHPQVGFPYVKALKFSPQSDRLIWVQSPNTVHVYSRE